eukprot:2775748-Rhodomonas_salina.1
MRYWRSVWYGTSTGVWSRGSVAPSVEERGTRMPTRVFIADVLLWSYAYHIAVAALTGCYAPTTSSTDCVLCSYQYFKVPEALQKRVLSWGILGA